MFAAICGDVMVNKHEVFDMRVEETNLNCRQRHQLLQLIGNASHQTRGRNIIAGKPTRLTMQQ
jgi:hypothetical protein